MLSKERIIWHLDVPVCRILSGLKIHLRTINMAEVWQMCYFFKCEAPELPSVMWNMIKKRKRRDPKWQKLKA